MIQLPQGFKINGRDAIDVRLILSKAEMLTINDNTMPNIYFAICKDDGKMYIYNKSNEALSDTGKYRLYFSNNESSSISKEEGNAIINKEDGLFVEQLQPISEEVIYNLFSSDVSKEEM